MHPLPESITRHLVAAAAVAALAGCASLGGTGGATPPGVAPGANPGAVTPPGAAPAPARPAGTPAAAGTSGPAAAAAPPAPGSPPPFDAVIKDAKKTDGLFTVWRKDDKTWLELKPEDFDKPFFLSPKLARGIGENGLFGGTMFGRWGNFGRPQIVQFQRVHNQIRLVAVNTDFRADDKSPQARGVQSGFSASLLGSAPVASAAHPQRKTVLIDAAAIFVQDVQGLSMALQRQYRQGYSFDPRHSGIDNVRTRPDAVIFEVTNHYATGSIAVPQPLPPGAPAGLPQPTTPLVLPDVRSMFMGLHYSISRLPEVPMAPRRADPRVGYFATGYQDYSQDLARTPRIRLINRWRLEKKDPAAALSEPVKPITFWLDRNIPLAYRQTITDGILAWNKAFERIGFKDALVVRQQADDADFDTLDVGVASVRWMINAQPQFGAIGPSQVDPRSGEILDADIGIESLSSRSIRATKSQVLGKGFTMDWAGLLQARDAAREGALPDVAGDAHVHGAACQHADQMAEQLSYGLEVLESRGEMDPDSPAVQDFVKAYLMDVTMHEVGHTLGLRHNFRSSRIYTDRQMSDDAFVRERGLAGSVMEYAPLNLPAPGEKPVYAFQTTLGPYDHWAIEYGYKPVDAARESEELQRIAARSAEPELAYGTDEDNYLGIDPESLQLDLGDDAVAFARKRYAIATDIIARQEGRPLKPSADYAVLRRSLGFAMRDLGRATGILLRQIGGVRTLRDFPGSGRDPLQPVAADVQRQALDAVARMVLSAESLKVSPALQRRLAPDFEERTDFGSPAPTSVSTDFSFDGLVTELRRAVLAQLMSDGLASRILDSESKVPAGQAFRLSELYQRLGAEIWSDLAGKGDITAVRRELQRDHVNRLAYQMLRPTSSRADTRALLRSEALALSRRLDAAARRSGLSAEAKAHLADCQETLALALAAKPQRLGL